MKIKFRAQTVGSSQKICQPQVIFNVFKNTNAYTAGYITDTPTHDGTALNHYQHKRLDSTLFKMSTIMDRNNYLVFTFKIAKNITQ